MSLSERQSELVDTHRTIHEEKLPYVLVGGWAVSAFQTRFTADIDMVLPEDAVDDYSHLLSEKGYTKEFEADVGNVYEGRVLRYTKPVGEHSVEFDAVVDALRCRQTDAEWSYSYLREHSVVEPLEIEKGLEARVPEPSLLFALKIHSGRLADARDLLVIAAETELDSVGTHLHRGRPEALVEQIERTLERFEQESFEDSFKGVFEQGSFPTGHVEEVAESLELQLQELDASGHR